MEVLISTKLIPMEALNLLVMVKQKNDAVVKGQKRRGVAQKKVL